MEKKRREDGASESRKNVRRCRRHGRVPAAVLGALAALFLAACEAAAPQTTGPSAGGGTDAEVRSVESVEDVPEYSGEPYVEINDNRPDFTEEELTTESYEDYSSLDALGRCGEAEACIGEDLMPTEERESISVVIPTGWENQEYEIVDGGYIYNRCHLIGFQLTGENANEKNLITGTRYMNTEGMLPFENMVAEYVHETENHVMYRVTPVFEGDDLVASGVQMEAESVEDGGEGICFNVYVYNVQPQITINYATGENWETENRDADAGSGGAAGETAGSGTGSSDDKGGDGTEEEETYILNTNTHKFHRPDCSSVQDMKEKNREEFTGMRADLIADGYEPCGRCRP